MNKQPNKQIFYKKSADYLQLQIIFFIFAALTKYNIMIDTEIIQINALFNEQLQLQIPLVVFRSATHYGSYVLLTELLHESKNFVLAIETNRAHGKLIVNSVRSVHYKDNPINIINWINENLADYIRPDFEEKWFIQIKNELLSKPQSNSVDVRKQLISAAKIIELFKSSKKS